MKISPVRHAAAAVVVVCSLVFLGGCGDQPSADGGNSGLTGSIVIEGSSTVAPVSNKAKEEFNQDYSSVNVSVADNGSSNGFKALYKKECDIADASRPIKQSEMEKCGEAGLKFFEIPVAYDGISVVVHKDNDFVDQLNLEQLKKIFREDMAVTKWNEVNPEWPDEAISIFAPGTASGTHDYFREVCGKKNLRSDEPITLSEDDKNLVIGVKGDKFSIGFFGFSYYKENEAELKIVPVIDPETGVAVTPSEATIESGEYTPFSRPLFIYVNAESYKRAEVREFVDFYLANAPTIAANARAVPLPDAVYQTARDHLDKELTGTHYLADGEKREGPVSEVYVQANVVDNE